jgi:hypothetical protein
MGKDLDSPANMQIHDDLKELSKNQKLCLSLILLTGLISFPSYGD